MRIRRETNVGLVGISSGNQTCLAAGKSSINGHYIYISYIYLVLLLYILIYIYTILALFIVIIIIIIIPIYYYIYIHTYYMVKSPNYMVDFPAGIGLPEGIAEPTH